MASFLSRNRGALLVLLSQIFSSFVNTGAKLLTTESTTPLSPFQILNIRMAIAMCLSSIYLRYKKDPGSLFGPSEVRWLLVFRGAGGTCGALGFYYSLKYLPLADATVLNLLAPLASCTIIALVVKKSFSLLHRIAATISLTGVVLVAKPAFLFGPSTYEPMARQMVYGSSDIWARDDDRQVSGTLIGVFFALIGVLGGACSYSCLRIIGTRANPLTSINYLSLTMIIITSVAMLMAPSTRSSGYLSVTQVVGLITIGVLGFVTEFLMTTGLGVEKSSSATQMIYSQVLLVGVLDWLIWKTVPSLLAITGEFLILGTLVMVLLRTPQLDHCGETCDIEISQCLREPGLDLDLESLLASEDEASAE